MADQYYNYLRHTQQEKTTASRPVSSPCVVLHTAKLTLAASFTASMLILDLTHVTKGGPSAERALPCVVIQLLASCSIAGASRPGRLMCSWGGNALHVHTRST